jgi:predicted O-methyltransferase YrrM
VLERLAELTDGVPHTARAGCEFLYETATGYQRPQILELCCGYGKATAYLAAAAQATGGFLWTADLQTREWEGHTATDLVAAIGASASCEIEYGVDARWYALSLFSWRPSRWLDLVFLDANHSVEVDGFLALAAWTHLRPGGVLIFDDLDWTAARYGPKLKGRTHRGVSHSKLLFDYVRQLGDVASATTWGEAEQHWRWGVVRKA